jgi:hypothetical protein
MTVAQLRDSSTDKSSILLEGNIFWLFFSVLLVGEHFWGMLEFLRGSGSFLAAIDPVNSPRLTR